MRNKGIFMKNYLFIFMLLICTFSTPVFAQDGVGIGTNTPNSSAILELDTSKQAHLANKGLLLPRLTDAQRDAIVSPAQGLLIYNTTYNRFEFRNSTRWVGIVYSATAQVGTLRCDKSVMVPPPARNRTGYSGQIVLPYTNGNGATIAIGLSPSAGSVSVPSAIHTLVATDGVLRFNTNIGNMPDADTVHYTVNIGGKQCQMVFTLN